MRMIAVAELVEASKFIAFSIGESIVANQAKINSIIAKQVATADIVTPILRAGVKTLLV